MPRFLIALPCLLLFSGLPLEARAQDTTTTTTTTTRGEEDPAPREADVDSPQRLGGKVSNRELRRGGQLGLGPFVGNLVGLSLRWWPSWRHAVTLDVGAPFAANSIGAALTYNLGLLIRGFRGAPVAMVASIGLGPRVTAWYRGNSGGAAVWYVELGARLPVGASLVFRDLPIELNLEAGPFLGAALGSGTGFAAGADGKVAVRLYF